MSNSVKKIKDKKIKNVGGVSEAQDGEAHKVWGERGREKEKSCRVRKLSASLRWTKEG